MEIVYRDTSESEVANPERLAAMQICQVGLGGIGSPMVQTMVKMGCRKLQIYDGDIVEEGNLQSQLYRLRDAEQGRPKALAMQEICREYGVVVEAFPEFVVSQRLSGLVIVGVDSMASRKQIWENCIVDNPFVEWLIDARMGGLNGTILTIRPDLPGDFRFYEASLYSDEESVGTACNGATRALIFNGSFIAALIGRHIWRIAAGKRPERRLDFDLGMLGLIVEE